MEQKLDLKGIANKLVSGGNLDGQKVQKKIDPSKGRDDDVPGLIDGTEPVALSEGEFVIPADVVAAVGKGSPEAGAQILQDMVDQIRTKGRQTKNSLASS